MYLPSPILFGQLKYSCCDFRSNILWLEQACWMSTVEFFICCLNCRWVIHFLTQLACPCLLNYTKRTSCEFKLDQNPVESARKVKTRPESLIRIPKQTSASHILLHSYAFFMRPFLRRSFICRINFLRDVESLRIFSCQWSLSTSQ